jgi:hypothetical protein
MPEYRIEWVHAAGRLTRASYNARNPMEAIEEWAAPRGGRIAKNRIKQVYENGKRLPYREWK